MSDQRKVYNFKDDPKVQEAVLAKCERLGISRSELLREWSRRFVSDNTDYDSPEELLGRAESLEEEANQLEEEAANYEERAASARERAQMLYEEAKDLRGMAESTVPYEEQLDDLAAEMRTSEMRLFEEHGDVQRIAREYDVPPPEILDDLQRETDLPDYRFIKGGEPGDTR